MRYVMLGFGVNYGIGRRQYLMIVEKNRREREKDQLVRVHEEINVAKLQTVWDEKEQMNEEYFVPKD